MFNIQLYTPIHLKQHTGPLDVSRESGASAGQVEETHGRASLEKLGCRTPPQLHAGGVGRQQQQHTAVFNIQLYTPIHLKQHTGPLDVSRESGASAGQVEETHGRASLEKLGCRTPPQLHAGGVGRQQQHVTHDNNHNLIITLLRGVCLVCQFHPSRWSQKVL